jgi:hypothetical protein
MFSLGLNNSIISVARARSVGLALAMFVALRIEAAAAQTQAGESAPAPRRFRIPAVTLTSGQFVYQTTLERDATTTILGTRTVTVSQTVYAGSPAWLLVETREGDGIPAADTLFAGNLDLHPIHWNSTLGGARLAAEFRGDTVFGATSAPSGRRSMVAAVPSGTFVSSAMLEAALRVLPLQTAWEDSTTTLSVSLSGNTLIPTRLSVIGEDRIRVPAGTFDCWVVAVHADPGRGLYWVTKRDPMVVRSAIDVPALGGAQLVSSLTRNSR